MKVFNSLNDFKINKKSVVTIGVFDGVHKGHCKLLSQFTKIADKHNLCSIILTFKNNPKNVFSNDSDIPKLITSKIKEQIIKTKFNPDYLIEIEFDDNIFNIESENFINNILKKKFNTEFIVIGHDFKFGKKQKGDFKLLQNYFFDKTLEVDAALYKNKIISSSLIKKNIKNNKFNDVNKMLGYNYFFEGKVVKGKKRGHKIGFPTANLKYPKQIIKFPGIFHTKTYYNGTEYNSISHIGPIPTFNNNNYLIETYIENFNENIYNKKIKVEIIKFIRKIIKFNSIDELKKQIIMDMKKI